MSWQTVKIGDFLKRSKIPVDIEDSEEYKRVTIRGKHQGVSLRDIERGKSIGTKRQFFLKEGQFILSKIDARYGAFGIAPSEVNDAIITGNFWAYDVDKEKVNIEWFNQYTNSPIFYDLCERASSGITHRKYLDENFFLNYEIDLPSIDEQEIVIGVINNQKHSINKVSTELNHQLALVKELRQAYLREAMQGKLVPQDSTDEPAEILLEKIKAEKEKLAAEKRIRRDKSLPPINAEEIPFEIPSNWTWCRLGELVSILGDGLHGTPQYSTNGEYYFVNGNNLINGKIEFKGNTKTVSFDEFQKYKKEMNLNTILVSINGTLGNIAFYNNEKIILGKSACYFNLLDRINKYFIGFLIKSPYFLKYAVDVASETTIKNVSLKSMRNLPVPLPPLAEQERIVAKLEKLMKFCDELEANIRQSATQAETLLQVALKEALEPK
jgi:type I restriction enzyme S subunit